jgi:hypothetical protein
MINTPIDPAVLRALWTARMSLIDIAKHFRVRKDSVSRAARRLGLESRAHKAIEPEAPPPRPAPRHTYATVQGIADAKGVTQREALCIFHRSRV